MGLSAAKLAQLNGQYLKKILQAPVYDVARQTPTEEAAALSRRLGNTILLKREDLQPIFSFKCRGAYNKIANLSEQEKSRGVIAASAGNHAQGVAMAAQKLGVKAIIVMPRTTPQIKVAAVRGFGANVVLHGDTYDEASAHAQERRERQGLVYVHPFDDPDVIAGQGTVALEILRQISGPLDAVFVPVGGGGLLAGMAAYIRSIRPDIKIIGVEAEDSACLKAAMDKQRRVTLPSVGIFADGVAVAQIGKETFRVIRDNIDEVVTANTDEICAAIKDMFEATRSLSEPSGALALAGMKKYIKRTGCKNQTLLAVCSGANTNFDRLRYISERTDSGERREVVLAVTIPERPGSFKAFCRAIGKRYISEFNYRYASDKEAQIYVAIKVEPGTDDRKQLLAMLRKKKYKFVDLSDNEMAKTHMRYMIGGRYAAGAVGKEEQVYRFEFPERPGALLNFLSGLGNNWNITLFHYRNHGAAYGRVLVGMQVPDDEREDFARYLAASSLSFTEETDNPAYQIFLQ